jgi:hypothetical protein
MHPFFDLQRAPSHLNIGNKLNKNCIGIGFSSMLNILIAHQIVCAQNRMRIRITGLLSLVISVFFSWLIVSKFELDPAEILLKKEDKNTH